MTTVSKQERLPLLAELSEDQASGDIRQIYQEVRRLSAVPMVAPDLAPSTLPLHKCAR
jgi:hypothetical protein